MAESATPTGFSPASDVEDGCPEFAERARKASISHAAANNPKQNSPIHFRWFEAPFQTKSAQGEYRGEATGWAMDASARGPLNTTGPFLGTAIIVLATTEALTNCTTQPCTVYGMLPSSLLTVQSTIITVAAALTMPLIGAVIDFTRHRKAVGAISAMILVLITGVCIAISAKTWFPIYILDSIAGYLMLVHVCAAMAYLPDLTQDHNELAVYTASFHIKQFFYMAVFTGMVTGLSYAVDRNSVKTAQIAQAIGVVWCFVLFGYAWAFLFRKRPPLRNVPEGSTLLLSGFKQISSTTKMIFSRYHGLKWFLMSIVWSPEEGSGVAQTIAVTFMVVHLQMDGTQIGYVIIVMLLSNVPGSYISRYLCHKLNAWKSFQLALAFFAVTIAMTAGFLHGPEAWQWIYPLSVLWGISYGWLYPSEKTVISTLTPQGQETEIMGVFTFYGQVLGWAPPFVATSLNEAGFSLRWGMSSLSFFLVIAVICTLFVNDYEKAVKEVQEHSVESRMSVEAANEELERELNEGAENQLKEGAENELTASDQSNP